MQSKTADLSVEVSKRLWATVIAPRPIAFVSTLNENETVNLAPYNSVAGVANNPPMLSFSLSKRHGETKNTAKNIHRSGRFVVNLVSASLAETMNKAAEGTDQIDDFARLGLTPAAFQTMPEPRVVESPAALACEVRQRLDLAPSNCEMFIAEVVEVYLADALIADGVLDSVAADLLASVGVESYMSLSGARLTLPRTWE